jgi:hypothetical protein
MTALQINNAVFVLFSIKLFGLISKRNENINWPNILNI